MNLPKMAEDQDSFLQGTIIKWENLKDYWIDLIN